jgi:hypothetical protein
MGRARWLETSTCRLSNHLLQLLNRGTCPHVARCPRKALKLGVARTGCRRPRWHHSRVRRRLPRRGRHDCGHSLRRMPLGFPAPSRPSSGSRGRRRRQRSRGARQAVAADPGCRGRPGLQRLRSCLLRGGQWAASLVCDAPRGCPRLLSEGRPGSPSWSLRHKPSPCLGGFGLWLGTLIGAPGRTPTIRCGGTSRRRLEVVHGAMLGCVRAGAAAAMAVAPAVAHGHGCPVPHRQ